MRQVEFHLGATSHSHLLSMSNAYGHMGLNALSTRNSGGNPAKVSNAQSYNDAKIGRRARKRETIKGGLNPKARYKFESN